VASAVHWLCAREQRKTTLEVAGIERGPLSVNAATAELSTLYPLLKKRKRELDTTGIKRVVSDEGEGRRMHDE